MPALIAVATAQPRHSVDQDMAREFAARLFGKNRGDIARLLPVFENSEVRSRQFCEPPEWFEQPHSFRDKNEAYIRHAEALVTRAIADVCRTSGVQPESLDHIFLVSTTGFATPSLDARVLSTLPLSRTILRTPIWGLGCAGGVAGLGRAHDWLLAYPDRLAVVVAVELCGMTFLRDDFSKSNFVATALFGDGCGAALVAGDLHPARAQGALSLDAAGSYTWPNTLEVMGWDFIDEGLKVIFSTSIPHLVANGAREPVTDFLSRNGRSAEEIGAFLSHPGGAKVIDAFEQAFNLTPAASASMRSALRHHGNMSSATVYHVLDHFLRSDLPAPGLPILSTALGPGFSLEMVLGTCL